MPVGHMFGSCVSFHAQVRLHLHFFWFRISFTCASFTCFWQAGGCGGGGVRVCATLRASRKEIPTTLYTQEGALSSSIEPKTKCEKGKAEGCPGVVSLWTVAVRVGARGGDLGGGFISWSKTPYAPQGGAADI